MANVERERPFQSAEETFERDRIDASVRANDGPPARDLPSVPPQESSDPRRSSSPFYGNTLVGVPPPPAKAATPRSLAVGAVYAGDFRIVRAIARGGMGAVFEVDQLSTGRRRALKVIRVPGALDVATRDRFLREARASALVDSPHVVEVVVAGSDEATGTLWIAMEFLAGETLADRLGRLQPGVALAQRETWVVLSELLRGLSKAHARGVVHRDLKPTNVFLARSADDGPTTVKILDFGIACFHEPQENKLTDPIGTPLWMAPEQARPSRITPSVDVWAVGLLAFRLFAGRSYWLAARDPSPNVRDVLAELLYEPLETASDRAEALGCVRRLPVGFDGWFARCVARDPADRFADAAEAAAALARLAPPDLALDPSPSRRPRPAMHPVARPEAAPAKPALGAPPRRPLNVAANASQRPARARHDSLHPRFEDDLHEAATSRMHTVSADEAIARVPAPTVNPAALTRSRAPTELLVAMPAATPPTAPTPSRSAVRFRIAILVAILVGGVAAILQAPGALRPRPMHAIAAHTTATSDARTGAWSVGEGRVWHGEASSADAGFGYTAVLRLTRPDRASGFISWTVERSAMAARGEQVRENVDGTWDPTLGTLELHGTLSTNPLVYPVNAYRLRVRSEGALEGQSLDAALVLHGVVAR